TGRGEGAGKPPAAAFGIDHGAVERSLGRGPDGGATGGARTLAGPDQLDTARSSAGTGTRVGRAARPCSAQHHDRAALSTGGQITRRRRSRTGLARGGTHSGRPEHRPGPPVAYLSR